MGERMEPAPISTHAERKRVYSAVVPPSTPLHRLTLYTSPTGNALQLRFESSATFMRYESPNFAVILGFLFVQPLIIYLMLAGRGVGTMVMETMSRGAYDIRRWTEELPLV